MLNLKQLSKIHALTSILISVDPIAFNRCFLTTQMYRMPLNVDFPVPSLIDPEVNQQEIDTKGRNKRVPKR